MTFNWVISQLDSIPSIDGMDKVISVIHYRAGKVYLTPTIDEETGQVTLGTPKIVDTYGALSLEAPHEASFTPYDEVTKEMVEGWLTESLDCEAIEANLDAQIENFLNPPIVAYALPWNSVSSAPVVAAAEETATEEPAAEEPAVEEENIAE